MVQVNVRKCGLHPTLAGIHLNFTFRTLQLQTPSNKTLQIILAGHISLHGYTFYTWWSLVFLTPHILRLQQGRISIVVQSLIVDMRPCHRSHALCNHSCSNLIQISESYINLSYDLFCINKFPSHDPVSVSGLRCVPTSLPWLIANTSLDSFILQLYTDRQKTDM